MIKKMILCIAIAISSIAIGQNKESISFISDTAEANASISASIENYDDKTTYILDIETANDMMILDNKIVNPIGNFKFYIEKPGRHLGTFKKINKKTGEKEFLQTVILTITPKITAFKITGITVKGFNQTKENYKAWDNAMSSYLPDVYFNVYKNDKLTYHSSMLSNRKPDVAFSWVVNQINWRKFTPQDSNDMFKIMFYDEDSVSNHDFMGGFQFSRISLETFFPKDQNKVALTYEKTKLVVEFEYKWYSE